MKKEKDMTLADHIKNFDFYKDLPRDLQEPSVSGASGIPPSLQLSVSFTFCSLSHGHSLRDPYNQIYGVQERQ